MLTVGFNKMLQKEKVGLFVCVLFSQPIEWNCLLSPTSVWVASNLGAAIVRSSH